MPCINATSAEDRGGRVGRVDDGNALLGAPGAPGCTTTGFAGSARCAPAAAERKTAATPAASHARITTPRTEPALALPLQRKPPCLQSGVMGTIFIWTRTKSFPETTNLHRGTGD